MKAEVVHVKGLTFTGKSDTGHWVSMDTKSEIGGNDGGTRPVEMVLIAFGGCTGMDVVSILKKMQVDYDSFEIKLEGSLAKDHPKVFEKIDLKYIFHATNIDTEKVEKAINLSLDKYCPVAAMLKHSVEINWELEINEPGIEE
jgi:putative redox protein